MLAEAIGTAFLLAVVVGSGIMAERLAGGNIALALLANALATGAGLFALIMTTHTALTADTTNGINFINKNNGWSKFFSSLEQVARAARAHTHQHFHKLAARDR